MPNIEVCENCGRQIGKLETAHVFNNRIICVKCDGKLRTTSTNAATNILESDTDQIKCPKCNSTQVMGGQKGFSGGKALGIGLLLGPIGLLAGLHGSKKIMISCLKCGHKWEPK